MYKIIKYTLAVTFGFLAQTVFGQTWVHTHTCDDGNTWIFVNDNIEKPISSNPTYLVTVEWEYSSEAAKKDLVPKKTIKVFEFAPDFTNYKIIESIDYNTKDNIINRIATPTETKFVSANSIEDIIVKEVQYILSEQYKIDSENATEFQIVEDPQ